MFVVARCHVENLCGARFVLSSDAATAPTSTLGVRRMLMGMFADDTKQTADHNKFHKSHFALQQSVVGCAAWSVLSTEAGKGKQALNNYCSSSRPRVLSCGSRRVCLFATLLLSLRCIFDCPINGLERATALSDM